MSRGSSTERLVVFDCDGVLVDSEAIVVTHESRLLTEAGFPMTVDEVIETCVGLSYPDMMVMLQERFGKPVPESLNEEIQAAALTAFPDELEPVAGIPDLLESLTGPRCVASSSNLDRITTSLQLTGLAHHFEPSTLFSAQMVTNGKPAPDLFLYAAEKCSTDPSDCIVIEDSAHGVAAAVAAGMQVIGYVAGRHARSSLAPRLEATGADAIAANAAELKQLIEQR